MRDVAERAGVHLSTVSRILNQPPHASASATARRVRAVARELGYQHDPVAASLRSGRTQTIGVVMPRLSDTVVATIYESIEETAAASGYHTLLVGTRDVSRSQERQAELLLSRRVDGLLLGACHLDDQLPQRLDARDAAYVIVVRRSRAHASVTIDDELGGYLATRHLIEQGHARVAMVSGPSTISTAYDRVQGYRRALQEAGIATAPDLVVETGCDVEAGRRAAEAWLAMEEKPTAAFAVTDYAALGVMGRYRDAGLQVGRDLALVGYHDIAVSSELPVPLSSVRTPLEELGRLATEQLLGRLGGEVVTTATLTPSLQVRASSTQPATTAAVGP
jgi:LacI family transcriptional regulator